MLKHSFLLSKTQRLVVLDEAQKFKNYKTQTYRNVKKLVAKCKVALSGTPIENTASEYFAIFAAVNTLLVHKTKDKQKEFKRFIRPFVLRKIKTDQKIINDLPMKIIEEILCPLTKEQKSLVDFVCSAYTRPKDILKRYTLLKQIGNHPASYKYYSNKKIV